ncbi:MAG: PIG-L family deacetylase, partial [Bacteroidota bacterium]|nr:PIG-L family deacetylase [Bacteroidota bacterium]
SKYINFAMQRLTALCLASLLCVPLAPAQNHVLNSTLDSGPLLAVDRGSTRLWQQLQKLSTTANMLHTVAHPDDEHAGLLAYLSRGVGARVALMSINRGEAGANAIGSELFDGLGLIRTEELRRSGRYYGLDDLYFSSTLDYGYSKTLDESLRSWDVDQVLSDMVRIIRMKSPFGGDFPVSRIATRWSWESPGYGADDPRGCSRRRGP